MIYFSYLCTAFCRKELVWAGRFIPLKHAEMMPRLAAFLREHLEEIRKEGIYTDFEIHMAGSGEMEESLKRETEELGVADRMIFHGFLPPEEIRHIMERCQIHVFTSNWLEGWGAVVNEAMNSGCAEVASAAAGAVPYLIRQGVNGIAYPEDIERALSVCREEGNEDVILLKCVSSYPTPYEAVNLRVIPTLQKTYDCLTGISDHTMGTIVSAGAVPLGAKMVEKHLTLKRSDGGPDSAFSMEPAEFKQMVDEIRILEKALGSSEYVLTDTQKLEHGGSRSLFVVKDIAAGEALTSENIRSIRPGCGLHTMYYEEVLGRKAKHFLKKGTPLAWDLID